MSAGVVDKGVADKAGMPSIQGVMAKDVPEYGAAAKGGIQAGDIILDIDGIPVNSSDELSHAITSHKAGDVVKIAVWHNNAKVVKTVMLHSKH
ncbi:MAG: PDZ domain-containing protein [Bacteroidota bacterium]